MPTPTLYRPAALAFALCGLIACARNDAPPASDAPARTAIDAPAQPAPDGSGDAVARVDDAAVAAFLTAQYGPGAQPQGKWTTAPADNALKAESDEADGAVAREVCAREHASIAGAPAVLLAVCGSPKDFGHPTPGITDFFLLQDRGGTLTATARTHKQDYGSMGNAGEVEVERFGADLYGFVVESGFFNMGSGVETRHVLLPRDGGFHEAGWFRAGMDNEEWMEGCRERGDCKPDAAYDIEFDMDIDDGDPQAAAYPIVVTESGNACGKPTQTVHRLTLDPATLTYQVPKALQRESCAVDGDG